MQLLRELLAEGMVKRSIEFDLEDVPAYLKAHFNVTPSSTHLTGPVNKQMVTYSIDGDEMHITGLGEVQTHANGDHDYPKTDEVTDMEELKDVVKDWFKRHNIE